jgi:NAD(P)-dependent dehydrogenase (short-subunit alcohol dehydrogenase family)
VSTVLVTGTSKGIGYTIALTLARAGHNVYATLRSPARAKELAAEFATLKLPVHVSVMDVDSDESVRRAIDAIYQTAGNIDVLVNNAGIARDGAVEDLSMEDIRATMETNFFGAVRCAKAVIPRMRERRSGCIVNVTSVAGRVTTSPLGVYSASKKALEAVSEALAQELKAFNIRVAVVEPGIIDTPMARDIGEPDPSSHYPQQRRMAHYFLAALTTPRDPILVAEKIQTIIESGTWQFRHPVGPGAQEHIDRRKATSDEDYIAFQSADDETWYGAMEQATGMKIRPS